MMGWTTVFFWICASEQSGCLQREIQHGQSPNKTNTRSYGAESIRSRMFAVRRRNKGLTYNWLFLNDRLCDLLSHMWLQDALVSQVRLNDGLCDVFRLNNILLCDARLNHCVSYVFANENYNEGCEVSEEHKATREIYRIAVNTTISTYQFGQWFVW